MNSPSIRHALLVRCGTGVGLLLCALSVGIYLTVRHGLYRELDGSITQTAALLSNQVELENDGITFEWKEGIGTNQSLIDDGLFQFWNEVTGETTRSPGLASQDLPKFCGTDGGPLLRDIELPGHHRHARAIGMRVYPFVLPDEVERMKSMGRVIDPRTLPHILVVARDAKPVHRVLARMRWILGIGTLLSLALVHFLIRRAIGVSLRPIKILERQMRGRTANQLDQGLELPGALPSELVGLAENFDALMLRVAKTRRRERDFVRHAAHELRTPIAGLQATTELALSKPRDAAEYASHLESCRRAAGELGDLVQRLSALARIGRADHPVAAEHVELAPVLEEAVYRFTPMLEKRGLKPALRLEEVPLTALGDPTLVRIVLNNLLDNAACHAVAGGRVTIVARKSGGFAEIAVSNPVESFPEDPERLFEPLFRRDASRHDSDSHLGIGLTLGQDAARSMGGDLTVRRTENDWIEFSFTLPLPPP